MRIIKIGLLFSILVTFATACFSDKGKKIPDVSHIETDIQIQRFEKDLLSIDTTAIKSGMDALSSKYPVFANEIFFPRILPMLQDTTVLLQFLKNPGIQKLYDTCTIVFGDASDIENELEQAFRFYKYYFPERKIPKVVSFLSEYSIGTFTYEEEISGYWLGFFPRRRLSLL